MHNLVQIQIREATAAQLLSITKASGETLDQLITRLSENCLPPIAPEQPPEPANASITIKAAPKTATGQYKAQYLGEELRSDILWDLFKQIVELSEDLDPEFVKELSTRILRSRRAVSKTRDGVHLRSKHLIVETQQTRGGYWISKNIGKDDLRRQCELLCNVAGLKFAYDLKLDLSGRD